MADNSITIVGNLTRDPEIRYTASGQANARLGIAVSRRWQNRQTNEWEERTSFFNVVAWGDMAENISDTLGKGNRVIVNGRLEQRSWETDQGEKRSVVEVVADEIGPSLRWATASVTRSERRGGGGQPGGGDFGGGGGATGPAAVGRAAGAGNRWRPAVAAVRVVAAPVAAAATTATTKSPSRRRSRWHETATIGARGGQRPPAGPEEEGVDPHPGQDRLRRLQGREPAPPVHVRAGQDPGPSGDRQQPAAAARDRDARSASRARWRSCRTACAR